MSSQAHFLLTVLLMLGSLATCGVLGWRAIKGPPLPAADNRRVATWPSWLLPAAIFCWLVVSKVFSRRLPALYKDGANTEAIHDTLTRNTMMIAIQFLALAGLVAQARWKSPAPEPDLSPIHRQLVYGLVGFLTCLLPTAIVFILTEPYRTDADMHPLLQLIGQDPSGQLLMAVTVSAVLVAPWTEEMAFRVIMQRSLLRNCSPSLSILLTAFAFCAIHPSWQDAVALLPLAIVLGVTYHRTGSYLAVVLIHMLFNAVNIVSMMAEP